MKFVQNPTSGLGDVAGRNCLPTYRHMHTRMTDYGQNVITKAHCHYICFHEQIRYPYFLDKKKKCPTSSRAVHINLLADLHIFIPSFSIKHFFILHKAFFFFFFYFLFFFFCYFFLYQHTSEQEQIRIKHHCFKIGFICF